MKVAWFTPFNIKSAIGRYSKFAVEALSKYADVEVMVFQSGELHKTSCKIVHFNQDNVDDILKNYDIAVYNMGDNAEYHSEIYDVLQRHPGVVIEHDICMHNFMRGYYLSKKNNPQKFMDLLEKNYGQEAAEMIFKAGQNEKEYKELDLLKYRLSEHIADSAFGVVVHSKYHESYAKQYYQGNIEVIAHLDTNDNLDVLDEKIDFNGYEDNRIHILTVGNINENKRIHKIINALGENSDLVSVFDYTIVGAQGNKYYINYLNELIKTYNLADSVHMVGFVDHTELAYYYAGADIVSNLRYPAYEGASGSIVEQMSLGKCCMVSNTGVYAEIDDGCLIKIDIDHEEEQIAQILRSILDGKVKLDIISENAKRYARQHFDRDLYAKKMYEFLKLVVFQRPLHVVNDKVISVMGEMPEVLSTELSERISFEMSSLYGGK